MSVLSNTAVNTPIKAMTMRTSTRVKPRVAFFLNESVTVVGETEINED